MSKKQIVIIVLVVAAFLLLVVSTAILGKALRQTREVADSRDEKFTALQAIYRAPVFPNRRSIEIYRKETEKMVEWTTNVVAAQKSVVAFDESLTPSQFMQVLQPTVRELARTKNRGGSLMVADGFAFGFDSYITGGQMPAAADVPKLTLQLEVVKRLCAELFQANVVSIRQLTRQQFENIAEEEHKPVAETSRSRRARARLASRGDAEPAAVTVAGKRALTGVHPFAVEFTARKEAMQVVLNRLAAMEMFVTVNKISISKAAPDIKSVPDVKREELKETQAPMRVITGPEIDPLLVVNLNLTVEIF